MAFLLSEYAKLLEVLKKEGYSLEPVKTYYESPISPCIYLRHDVDRFPSRAERMSEIENQLGISSTYYFRCDIEGVFPTKSIKRVAELGHEVGYHYETMARHKGDMEKAAEAFKRELTALKTLADVKTVSAHGSPLSKYSNVKYSEKIDLKELCILGESTIDYDFSKVLYVTDTGGIFGSPFNLRDWAKGKNLNTSTKCHELIRILKPKVEPLVLLNTHPERWPESFLTYLHAESMDLLINMIKFIRNPTLIGRRSAA